MQPGMTVSAVAWLHGVSPSLLCQWRRRMAESGHEAVRADGEVVPVIRVRELKARVRPASNPPVAAVDRTWTEIAAELGSTREAVYRALAVPERDRRILRSGVSITLGGGRRQGRPDPPSRQPAPRPAGAGTPAGPPAARADRPAKPDGLSLLQRQAVQAGRGYHGDAGGRADQVEGHPDRPRVVLVPGLRNRHPAAGAVPPHRPRPGGAEPAGGRRIRRPSRPSSASTSR